MEFCYQYLKDGEDYHHHKERMAFFGLGVQIAFFAGFMTTDKLPVWLCELKKLRGPIGCEIAAEYILVLIVVVLWLFMHAFVRWQLIMRRDAAFHVLVLRDLILEKLGVRRGREVVGMSNVIAALGYALTTCFPLYVCLSLRHVNIQNGIKKSLMSVRIVLQ